MSMNTVNTQITPQKRTGGIKKAIASTFVPGLGQFLDSRKKEGCFYLIGIGSSAIVSAKCFSKYNKDVFEASKKASKDIFNAQQKATADAYNTFKPGTEEDLPRYISRMQKKATSGMIKPEDAFKTVKKDRLYIGISTALICIMLLIANVADAYKGDRKKLNKQIA